MSTAVEPTAVPTGVLVGKSLLYFTSIFVSLGVFIFGFDQGLMSGLITNYYFRVYFNSPTPTQIGTMVAILEIGALISSLMVGRIGDNIGRRRTIRYGSFIFVVGGFVQATCRDIWMLSFGRFISGLGVGLLSAIVPIYQSEISPPHNRGKLACIEFTGNIFGYASSIWVDYFCSFIESDYSWRTPLFTQCAMGSLLFFGSFLIVETPRWLLDNDHDAEGIIVLADLYCDGNLQDERARDEYRSIKENVMISRLEGGERSYAYMFKRYRKRVIIAMGSQAFAQLNGINIISYYAPMVFEQAGWLGRDAILMAGINAIIYILSTIPPWYLVDSWGRRSLLLSGSIFMGIPLFLISYFMYINIPNTPIIVVGLVIVYNASFGFSWGPIPWLYPPEILPTSVRSKGASLSTASNWAFNWLVGEMTPILQDTIKWRLYLLPATSCFISFLAVYVIFPETMGLHLEDMDSVFDDSSSIFSFHNSNSNYGSTANSEATSIRSGISESNYRSPAAIARNHALKARPDTEHSLLIPSLQQIYPGVVPTSPNSLNPIKSSDQSIPPINIEPPDYSEILAFKQNNTLVRRGRNSIQNLLGAAFTKTEDEEQNGVVESASTSNS